MAQYRVKDPEELIECPYDRVHMIRNKRFRYHLMKCRKNYTGTEYLKCPFNACHEFPKPELKYHVANCPDKAMIEKDLLFGQTRNEGHGTYFRGCTESGPEFSDSTFTVPPSRENWDREVSPHPIQMVDKAIFTGTHRRNYLNFTPSEKLTFMEGIRKRGIPLDDPLPKVDGDSLRLPHQPPRVLCSAKPRFFADTFSLDGRSVDEESEINLTKNVALLQSLATGRGKSLARDRAQDLEPLVGERSAI